MIRTTLPPGLSRLLNGVGWVAVALVLALGSAGLVSALDHRPGTAARAELTWAADQSVLGRLNGMIPALDPIAVDFDNLGGQGRGALAALVATNPDALEAALARGSELVAKISGETGDLQQQLADLPGAGPGAEGSLSAAVRYRVATVAGALDATGGTAQAWATLASGAGQAARLTRLLRGHDESSGRAVVSGSQGDYAGALKALDQADPALADARELRDQLANTTDVSTLTQWLDRNAAIDAALRNLYTVLEASGGKLTDEARKAVDQVRTAQQQLPSDTKALIVIMSDIARAGLNQAVIRIEETRGKLASAIATLGPALGPSPGTDNPSPDSTDQPQMTPPDA